MLYERHLFFNWCVRMDRCGGQPDKRLANRTPQKRCVALVVLDRNRMPGSYTWMNSRFCAFNFRACSCALIVYAIRQFRKIQHASSRIEPGAYKLNPMFYQLNSAFFAARYILLTYELWLIGLAVFCWFKFSAIDLFSCYQPFCFTCKNTVVYRVSMGHHEWSSWIP